jgi:hypothetical protein
VGRGKQHSQGRHDLVKPQPHDKIAKAGARWSVWTREAEPVRAQGGRLNVADGLPGCRAERVQASALLWRRAYSMCLQG